MFFIFSLIIQILIIRLVFSLFFRLFGTGRENRSERTEWRQYNWSDHSGWSDYSGWSDGYDGHRPYSSQPSELSLAYATLGVKPEASDSEVRSAYRRLALQFHPDRFATATREAQIKAEEQFKKINDAYQTIKKKRGLD